MAYDIPGEVLSGLRSQIKEAETANAPALTNEDHLRWMLDQLLSGHIVGDKAHRWLGFVQGVLAARGHLSVLAERDRTRPYLTAAENAGEIDEFIMVMQRRLTE